MAALVRSRLLPALSHVTHVRYSSIWYNGLAHLDKVKLRDKMQQLDNDLRHHTYDSTYQSVSSGISQILIQLQKNISQTDQKFKNIATVPVGSQFDHTAISKQESFDFGFRLENIQDISTEESGSLYREFPMFPADLSPHSNTFPTQIVCRGLSNQLDEIAKSQCTQWKTSVEQGLAGIMLPQGWQHAGENKPKFSGVKTKDPALVVEFSYLNPDPSIAVVPVILHITPLLTLQYFSNSSRKGNPIQEAIKNDATLRYLYLRFQEVLFIPTTTGEWILSTSFAEKRWLDDFSETSPSKQVIRLCKFFNQPQSSEIDPLHSTYPESTDGALLVDNYVIKKSVLSLMTRKPDKGHGWTDMDVPKLVISVFEFIRLNMEQKNAVELFVSLDSLGDSERDKLLHRIEGVFERIKHMFSDM